MTAVLWTCVVALALIAAVLTSWLIPAIREVLEERRANWETPQRDSVVDTAEIRRQEISRELRVTRSPMLTRRPTPRPTVQERNHARLDQQARHAAVVTAGPFTREFNARVEWETGRPPKGKGPREADVRPEWSQLDLFAEVG